MRMRQPRKSVYKLKLRSRESVAATGMAELESRTVPSMAWTEAKGAVPGHMNRYGRVPM